MDKISAVYDNTVGRKIPMVLKDVSRDDSLSQATSGTPLQAKRRGKVGFILNVNKGQDATMVLNLLV